MKNPLSLIVCGSVIIGAVVAITFAIADIPRPVLVGMGLTTVLIFIGLTAWEHIRPAPKDSDD